MTRVEEIKIAAYNFTPLPGMSAAEQNLYNGLAYCYEWYRAHPEDRKDCEERANKYIEWYEWEQLREIKHE